MDIDWITVSAQIVNFLILVGLLKHFLYRPVLEAMDRREARIAARLTEADAREQEARETASRYRSETEALDRRRESLLAEAANEADAEKKRLLEQLRAEIVDLRASWHRQVGQEKEAFLAGLRRESADAVQAAVRRALSELADAELEQRILRVFQKKLRGLDDETRRALAEAEGPVRIASAFPLGPDDRAQLARAVHEQVSADREVIFEQDPALLCGVELSSGGLRSAWNLEAWLDELAERVGASLAGAQDAQEGG